MCEGPWCTFRLHSHKPQRMPPWLCTLGLGAPLRRTERRNYTHWENSVGATRQRFKGLGDLEHDLELETWALSKDILSQVTVNGQTRNRPGSSDAWKLGQGPFFPGSENDTFTPQFHFFYSELVSNQQFPWSHLYLPKLFFPTISLTVDLSLFSYPRQTLLL